MHPLVSVIIPLYNVEKYIVACLDSVVKQDADFAIEVLVVDDCGSDSSLELAKEYARGCNRPDREFIFLQHDRNKGQAAARNTGVREARGKYIFFIDSDDSITPDCIRLLVEEAELTGCDIVQGETIHVSETTGIGQAGSRKGCKTISPSALWLERPEWHPVAWNKIIRRQSFIDNSLWFGEGFFFEDIHWTFLVGFSNCTIRLVDKPTYNYLLRGGSTTTSHTMRHLNDFVTMIRESAKLINANLGRTDIERIRIVAVYETTRALAVDLTYPFHPDCENLILFNGLRRHNIFSLREVMTNPHLSWKVKSKTLAFYCGSLGHKLINLRKILK